MSRLLPLAQYYYAIGNQEKALSYAKDGLKHLDTLVEAGLIPNPRDRMAAALAVYDQINGRVPLSKERTIEMLTSKIGKNIILPAWAWQLDEAPLAEFQEYQDEMESFSCPELPVDWIQSDFKEMTVERDEIVQSSLGDCSVVASLIAVNARTANPMLQRIYPQQNGRAVISPSGHYCVKLTLSGTERIIEISDRRPVSRSKGLPLHLITRKGSAWPFLCEKAYMKLMGGYSFAGSHAALDTYRMTSWLPDFVDLTAWSAANPGKTLADLFGKWESQWRAGTAILCLGTNSDAMAPLAPSHDYAIVDIAEGRAKVVNPWLSSAENRWYTWDEISWQFAILYLNTDPGNWRFHEKAHLVASMNGLDNMQFNLGAHPQYTIHNPTNESVPVQTYASVKPGPGHRSGFLNIQGYLCDHRVYSPQNVELVSRSQETNALYSKLSLTIAPHTSITYVFHATQLKIDSETAVFSVEFCSNTKITAHKPAKMACESRLVDCWSALNACSFSDPRLGDNPQFYIDVKVPAKQLNIYYIPYQNSLGKVYSQLAVFYGDQASNTTLPSPDVTQSLAYNSVYNRGSTSTRLNQISPGRYVVIPALSEPVDGEFAILATCDAPVVVGKLLPLHSGLFERQFVCRGTDVEVSFKAPQTCDISFQVDAEVESRLCVYDDRCNPLAASNGTEFKRGRLLVKVTAGSGFCKVETKRGCDLVLQAFAIFPIDMAPA